MSSFKSQPVSGMQIFASFLISLTPLHCTHCTAQVLPEQLNWLFFALSSRSSFFFFFKVSLDIDMQCFWGGVCNESAHCTIYNQGKIVQAIDIEAVRLACWVLLYGQKRPFSLLMANKYDVGNFKMLLLKMILLYESTLLIVIGTIAKKNKKSWL